MAVREIGELLEFLQPFFYGGLTLAAFVQWRRHPGRPGAWLCGAFGVLAIFFIADGLLPEDSSDPIVLGIDKVTVALLSLFPYSLYGFMRSFVRSSRWSDIGAATLTAAVALGALALPNSSSQGDASTPWVKIWVAALLIQWVSLSGLVAVRLWRAGRGQPSVARRRMRTMSLAAVGLALAAVVEGEVSNGGVAALVVQLLALSAAPLMLVGFAPPTPLRAWWRRSDETALKRAELSLMEATTTPEVIAVLLPQARVVLGASRASLQASDGKVVGTDGVDADDAQAPGRVPHPRAAASGNTTDGSVVSIPMRAHRLSIFASPFTPFFGHEETATVRALAALADLTLARNELLEDQRRLAAVVESSSHAIIGKSLEGIISSWNPGAEAMYGYRAEEVVGKPVSILVPQEIEDDLAAILAKVRAGEVIEHYETKRQTKTGEIIDISLGVSPLRDEAGTIVGASAIARDITEQKAAEAALVEREAMLAAIFETSPDIIATITTDLELTYVNPAAREILGYEFDQLFGEDALHWVHPEDMEIAGSLLQTAFGTGETGSARLRVKNAAQQWMWLDIRIRRMRPATTTAVILARDVSTQVHLEEELQQAREVAEGANLAKSEFLSRMSHELRTPLNAILGFGQLLETENLSPDERDSTEQIIKGGRRLLELIDEVLDISRIESGTLRLSLEPVPVGVVVQDAVELIRPLADERGIELHTELPTEVEEGHVVADQRRLGQILLNLLSNAVKYNVQHGTVWVTGNSGGQDRVRIGISDTGPGIAEDQISLLFAPFERLGAERTAVEGTGLGLALSKSLMKAMGGSLEVETMPGEGTTFWVNLQAADGPSTRAATPPHHELGSSLGSTGKVLYIEDNFSNLRLIERLLTQRADVELISAMTGTLGIDLAQQHIPDLVLLDLHLPDLRGEEVLIRLRSDPRTRTIPVVILSADATPGQIERLRAAGANEYLTKPIDVPAFVSVIDRILSSSSERAR